MEYDKIRGWILGDEYLYLRAREFGKGGDDEMYANLPEFIEKHKKELVEYIEAAENGKPVR